MEENCILTLPEAQKLACRSYVFSGYGDTGQKRTIQWMRKSHMPDMPMYTNPKANASGVSGWCILDGIELRRVHVCAHYPCHARHTDRNGNVAVWVQHAKRRAAATALT